MMHTERRRALKTLAAGLGAAALLPAARVLHAQQKRSLHAQLVGYTLGIHVPQMLALRELLLQAGYAEPKLDRIESMQVIAQSIIAGSAEIGDTDVVSALRASEAGASVAVVGLVYNSTSQVLVVNSEKIKGYEDFKDPSNAIALNNMGDFIYVMVNDALARNGVDIQDATVIEIGGSGSRMSALMAGRIAAVPLHFDQAAEVVARDAKFKVLVQPWKEYDRWFSEVWLVSRKWLQNEANQRALVDFTKAVITAFRKATDDYDYFAAGYRKYATVPGHAEIADDALRPIWQTLAQDIKAWPADGGFKREYFEPLLPIYRKAHALKGNIDLVQAVEPRYVEQALQELG